MATDLPGPSRGRLPPTAEKLGLQKGRPSPPSRPGVPPKLQTLTHTRTPQKKGPALSLVKQGSPVLAQSLFLQALVYQILALRSLLRLPRGKLSRANLMDPIPKNKCWAKTWLPSLNLMHEPAVASNDSLHVDCMLIADPCMLPLSTLRTSSFVDAVLRAISANWYIASRSLKSHMHTLIYEHRVVVAVLRPIRANQQPPGNVHC